MLLEVLGCRARARVSVSVKGCDWAIRLGIIRSWGLEGVVIVIVIVIVVVVVVAIVL